MSGFPPKKNATFTWYFFIRDADGDPVAGAADLDVEYSGDGGVFGDVAGTETDEGEGLYSCIISNTEMNYDVVALICKTSTAGAKTAAQVIYTSTRQIDDLAYPATSGRSIQVETDGMIHADVKEWLASAPLALVSQLVQAQANQLGTQAKTDVQSELTAYDAVVPGDLPTNFGSMGIESDGHVHADIKEWLGAAPNALQSGRTDSYLGAIAAAVITNAAFAAGALDANALATDAINEIADGVWDEDIEAAHGTDATAGLLLRILGAVISNRSNNATLDALLGVPDVASTNLADAIADEDLTGHSTVDTLGNLLVILAKAIQDRTNSSNLNALLGVADSAGEDVPSQVTDEVLDEDLDAHVTADTLGAVAKDLSIAATTMVEGTVDDTAFSPTTTEFEADDITVAAADHFNSRIVIFTSGTLQDQQREIADYVLAGGRGHFTVAALTTAPGNDDTFVIV